MSRPRPSGVPAWLALSGLLFFFGQCAPCPVAAQIGATRFTATAGAAALPASPASPEAPAPVPASHHTLPPDTTRRIERALLPLLGYDTETGVSFGVLAQRNDERAGYEPHYASLRAQVAVTTRGFYTAQIDHDTFAPFSGRLRVTSLLYADRFLREPFFGPGNGSTYSDSLWDAGAYFHERRQIGLEIIGAMPVGGPHSLLLFLDAIRDASIANSDGSDLFRRLPSEQTVGSGLVAAGLGWSLDTRDDELIPRRGVLLEAGLRATVPGLSTWSMREVQLDLRQYRPLLRHFWIFGEVTLAQRLRFDAAWGEVPYWREPRLGSEDDLRGYPLNRFQGRASWLHMLELRSWFLELPDSGLRLGGHFFWDVGRVFGGGESYTFTCPPNARCTDLLPRPDGSEALLRDLHHAYGFGGVLAPGESDFFVRMDFGFTPETRQVGIGAGYAF